MKMKTLLPSFMLFACTFQTIALNSETQNTIIKLEQSVISVGQLITQIENQTDYLVVFKSREVDIERYITVQNTSGKMISYLEEAFKDTDITYEFDNRYILLLKKNDKGRTSLIGQQSRTITGTVTDNNGEPVIGANVIIKGTSIGTVTDINGKYTLEVPPKAILQISYIGYLTKEIVIDNNKTADVILIEDTQKIDEVVVVGYGTQKKGEVASSISTIKSDNFDYGCRTTDQRESSWPKYHYAGCQPDFHLADRLTWNHHLESQLQPFGAHRRDTRRPELRLTR